ncbi:MAG TPA: DUF4019 domain-containing protein [Bryobacteraceae bacterium]|nr:DUF4019 domain-containing protein [Bryobacteraceae bacterium]
MRLILVVTLVGIASALMTAATPAEDEASAAGQKWLALLDDLKYGESWSQAGSMFRDEVNQDQWVAVLKRLREPMGPMISRTAARIDFVKTLRGAPDGDYAIIHFTTSFKNKSGVTERLTLVKEGGRWQAAAYAIH